MKQIKSLYDIQQALDELFQWKDKMDSKNIDLSGRRIINAGPARDKNDYVTSEELKVLKDELKSLKIRLGVR